MRRPLLLLPVGLACAAGALALGTGASNGQPRLVPTASFTAVDFAWNVTGSNPATHEATIAPGDSVGFDYPSGSSAHNAGFTTTTGVTCSQTAGANTGAVPPLPHTPTAAPWTGTCTFTSAGDFAFHCDLHGSMTGTVHVVDPNAPPPPPPPPPGVAPTPPPPPPGPQAPDPPTFSTGTSQTGFSVTTKVTVSSPSHIRFVLVAPAGIPRAAKAVTVGRKSAALPGGTRTFAITLNSKGKGALRRKRRLKLQLRTTVMTDDGSLPAKTTTSRITLQRK